MDGEGRSPVLSEFIGTFLSVLMGPAAYGRLMVLWMFVLPMAWMIVVFRIHWRGRGTPLLAMGLGLVAAAWASGAWLMFPYVGGYPNLVPLLLASAAGVGEGATEATVHIFNAALWPWIMWRVMR